MKQNIKDIELAGALNKSEFYPAKDGWAECIGVYEIEGKNWLFFNTFIEGGYDVPSVKFFEKEDAVRFSPRRLCLETKEDFVPPKEEQPVVSLARWLRENRTACPFDRGDFKNTDIWVSAFPFAKTDRIQVA